MAKYHRSSEEYLDDRISQAISNINHNYEQYEPFIELFCAGKEAEIRNLLEITATKPHIIKEKCFSNNYLLLIKYQIENKDAIYVSAIALKNTNINYSISSTYRTSTNKIILEKPQIEVKTIEPIKELFKFRTALDLEVDLQINYPSN